MESTISFIIACTIVSLLGVAVAYCRQRCADNNTLVSAFKEIIRHRFYDDFTHGSIEQKKLILIKLEVMRDEEVLHVFDHPKEFLTALKYMCKVMKEDIAMEEAMIRADALLAEMEK